MRYSWDPMQAQYEEDLRRARAIQRRITDKQLDALRHIAAGRVKVDWGMTTIKPCPVTDNTLWSLELRGLVRLKGEPGKVRLTPAGAQVAIWNATSKSPSPRQSLSPDRP